FGADLHLDRLVLRANHRGVQRLVEVALGPRDVVVELLRDRLPQVVDDAERGIAVLYRGHDDAQRAHVVDLAEVERLRAHLVPDRVDVLRPAVDLGLHAGGLELAREHGDGTADVLLALQALLVEHAGNALVELRLEEAERQVFKLPLELEHAQAVRERRIDVEALARVDSALGARVAREPAQRLRAAREAYEDHAHVLGHAEDHLAQHLVLLDGVGARGKPQLVELLDARREVGDLVAVVLAELLQLDVFRRREKKPGDAPRRVKPDGRKGRREAERVSPGRLAGREELPGLNRLGERQRLREARPVRRRQALGERIERARRAARMQLHYRDHA